MSEMPRWLELQAEIDYWYWVLGEIQHKLPKSTMDKMVDDATGHTQQLEKGAMYAIRQIRKLRKEYDTVAPKSNVGEK